VKKSNDKIRLAAIVIVSFAVIVTGALFSFGSLVQGEVIGAFLGAVIAITILFFAVIVFARGSAALKDGFPLHDERSRKVLEKASSKAFYVSLYMLLGIGFLSDIITFRDVSQATSVSVGIMAILFAVFWAYYSRKAL
jgi:uncharacterized membrane protein